MTRIHRLLSPQRSKSAGTPLLALTILLLTATVGLAAWHSQPANAAIIPDQSAFTKWLNQDVVYIINDRERSAFLKLNTDEERQKFVDQFWLRRDAPGAPAYTFKEEHYHRAAYADHHFASSSQPGWQTDRGHMYIVYGPPDEIDAHLHDVHPFENWLYRHVEGVGDNVTVNFVDPDKTGDWRIAPSKGSAGSK